MSSELLSVGRGSLSFNGPFTPHARRAAITGFIPGVMAVTVLRIRPTQSRTFRSGDSTNNRMMQQSSCQGYRKARRSQHDEAHYRRVHRKRRPRRRIVRAGDANRSTWSTRGWRSHSGLWGLRLGRPQGTLWRMPPALQLSTRVAYRAMGTRLQTELVTNSNSRQMLADAPCAHPATL
jgi:hypothetical protein